MFWEINSGFIQENPLVYQGIFSDDGNVLSFGVLI